METNRTTKKEEKCRGCPLPKNILINKRHKKIFVRANGHPLVFKNRPSIVIAFFIISYPHHAFIPVVLVYLRPHWEKCAQYVEGGADRWNELSQDRSSDELVDVLLAEMTGQDIAVIQAGVSTGAEYFQGQVIKHSIQNG